MKTNQTIFSIFLKQVTGMKYFFQKIVDLKLFHNAIVNILFTPEINKFLAKTNCLVLSWTFLEAPFAQPSNFPRKPSFSEREKCPFVVLSFPARMQDKSLDHEKSLSC